MSDNLPLSEQYRIVAKQWVDAEAAASLLEDTKSSVLSQRMQALINNEPGLAINRAEATVKASDEWVEWIAGMVDARKKANLLKVQIDYIKMKAGEQASYEATKRAEMKL